MSDSAVGASDPSPSRTSGGAAATRRPIQIATLAAALLGAAVLLDATIETTAARSSLWWWAVGVTAAYVAVTVVALALRVSWRSQVSIVIAAVFGLAAATAWRPDGLNAGVHLIGQPTPRVLALLTALGLLVAIVVVVRATTLPLFVRLIVALVAAYGAVAFALGARDATAYQALFAGEALWRALPRWLQGSVVGGLGIVPLALLLGMAEWLRRAKRDWTLQQVVALALTAAIVASGFTNAAGAGRPVVKLNLPEVAESTPPPTDDRAANADAMALLKKVASDPVPSTSDVERKADEIGNDPAALFAYVHDNVRLQIYPGVLRGARGALTGGAGNAWDRSLLLAAMLRHHGREVRFARARLAPDAATKIVARMFADGARPRAAAKSIPASDAVQKQTRALMARIQTTWQQSYTDVLQTLERSGLGLGDSAVSTETLAAEAADHLWVEYRDGERWVPVDPSAVDRPGEAITEAGQTFVDVPDDSYHRVTIRVTVEERRGQALETQDVFRYETTAAALHGAQVLFSNAIGGDLMGRWQARPIVIIDGRPFGAMKFSATGVVTTAPKRDVIAQAHEAVGQLPQVLDAFGGDAQKPAAQPAAPSKEFVAERLEVDFTDPAGHVETARRDVVDRIGVTARRDGGATTAPLAPIATVDDIPVQLTSLYACAFTAGALDPVLLLRQLAPSATALDAAAIHIPAPVGPAAGDGSRRVDQSLADLLTSLSTTAATAHLLSQRLAPRFRGNGSLLFYESTPRLAIASLQLAATADGRGVVPSFAIDLRRDGVRVVGQGAPKTLVLANAARGVLDAVIEDTLVPVSQSSAGPTISTVGLMGRAHSNAIALVVLRDASAAAALPMPAEARARLAADTRNGVAIVTSARPVQAGADTRSAWWTIDLATGETIGMIDNGLRGAELPENAALAETVVRPGAQGLFQGFGPMELVAEYRAGMAAGYRAGLAAAAAPSAAAADAAWLALAGAVFNMGLAIIHVAVVAAVAGLFAAD